MEAIHPYAKHSSQFGQHLDKPELYSGNEVIRLARMLNLGAIAVYSVDKAWGRMGWPKDLNPIVENDSIRIYRVGSRVTDLH